MSSPIPESPTDSQQHSPDLLSPNAAKKARRQTAFYPNTAGKPQKPFSRSAAKRESVMALGSIEHLQHYFTKAGFAAAQNPLKPSNNAQPALGPGILKIGTDLPALASDIILPPTPVLPPRLQPIAPPYIKTYQVDPQILKPGVIDDLEATEHAWNIGASSTAPETTPRDAEPTSGETSGGQSFDILAVLKTTTRAIRSVRNYLMSLPDDFTAPRPQAEFRPSTLSPPTAPLRKSPKPSRQASDPLALVRKSALEVLTMLRHLEENARLPLSDDAYEVQSDSGSASTRSHTPGGTDRVASPFTDDESTASFSFSVTGPSKKNGVLVWSDEEEGEEDNEEKKERWDERLVLGGGWLYKQDLSLEQLGSERESIGRYLDAVDALLFSGGHGSNIRGWVREKERLAIDKGKEKEKGRRQSASDGEGKTLGFGPGRGRRIVSTGMLDAMRNMVVSEEPEEIEDIHEDYVQENYASVEDEDLPDWAKRSRFADDPLGRLMSLLITLLPAESLPLLPPPNDTSRSTLLGRLSSGQLLCTAYNIGVRRSKKPWGYISPDSIHDIAAMEAQAEGEAETERERRKVGWTFRRTDNLRLWAAALRLRYMLNVGPTPAAPTKSSSPGRTSQSPTPIASPTASHQTFSIPPHEAASANASTNGDDQFVRFDPQSVAKREEGWETMLEGAVMKWMWAVVEEKRGMKR